MDIYTPIPVSDKILRLAIYEAHRGLCFYTGRKVEFLDMVIDHIAPKARGGQDCIANYVLTCPELNSRKSDRIDESLIERMLYINKITFAASVLQLYLSNESPKPNSYKKKIILPKARPRELNSMVVAEARKIATRLCAHSAGYYRAAKLLGNPGLRASLHRLINEPGFRPSESFIEMLLNRGELDLVDPRGYPDSIVDKIYRG